MHLSINNSVNNVENESVCVVCSWDGDGGKGEQRRAGLSPRRSNKQIQRKLTNEKQKQRDF